jgi:hypothetical protein
VESFLERWYGSTKGLGVDNATVDTIAPFALVRWHSLASRAGTRITFHDYPIALQDLKWDSDGMLSFWVENQNGVYWAVEQNDSRHMVFSRKFPSGDWQETGESVDEFLLHCTVSEAIIGADRKFTVLVPESRLSGALESFIELKFPALASENSATKIWSSRDALASITRPPVGYENPGEHLWMLTFAAPRDGNVSKYAPRFGIDPDVDFVVRRTDPPHEPPPF